MRIAVVHSYYSAAMPSGENAVVRDQVDLLRDAGHDVLEVSRATDERQAPGYAVRAGYRVATGRGDSPEDELVRFAPDVVHLHNTFPNWGTRWLDRWAARTVATVHNYRSLCANGLLFRDGRPCRDCLTTPVLPAVRHRCYRNSAVATLPVAVAAAPGGALNRIGRDVARLVALNEESAGVFRERLGREVLVVPNFVTDAPDDGTSASHGSQGWGYVGRFSVEKGVGELLRSWPEEADLELVGDGPLRDEVVALAAQRPALRVTPVQDRATLRARLARWRGIVVPSLVGEGLPTVALEALAAGTPLLVSHRISASEDMIRSGAAVGFDPTAPTAALRRALTDVTSNWEAMSRAARELHRTAYSPQAWLSRMEAVYESV